MAFGSAQFLLQFSMSCVQLLQNASMGWYGASALGVHNGGDIALSGMSIIGAIALFFFLPIFGVNQGAQPILGYNYGAKKFDRVLSAYLKAITTAIMIAATGFIVTMLFPSQIIELFTPERSDELLYFSTRAARIFFLLMPLNGFQIISANLFVVTGRPKITIFLSLLRQCLVLIPCMLIFGRVWGLWGVVAAGPVSDGLSFIFTGVMIFWEIRRLKSL
jgi:Na+-driven multidrug efflux pump